VEQVRIGIIGAGRLGTAVARRLLPAGHDVVLGGGAGAQEAAADLGVQAVSNRVAAAFAEVVVLAVPFAAIQRALEQAWSER